MIGAITAGVFSAPSAPVTSSYESIATQTVGSGGTASISFTSIPATFKHLQIRINARGNRTSGDEVIGLRLNGSTTTSQYVSHRLTGDASSASGSTQGASSYSSSFAATIPATSIGNSTTFGSCVIDILDYTSTVKNKVSRSLGGFDANGSGIVWFGSELWILTNAVTQVDLIPVFGTLFNEYSSFALYGIKV